MPALAPVIITVCLTGPGATARSFRSAMLAGYPLRGAVIADPLSSRQVEPVEVHHLDPRPDEVADELLPGVVAGVDLRDRPQLGVVAEDQVHPAAGPLDRAGGRLPRRAHVEQVDEEVIGQDAGPGGEDAER